MGPEQDPETAFFDRVIGLLQSEGREAGTWDQIIARVQELRADASADALRAARRAKNGGASVVAKRGAPEVIPLTDEEGSDSYGDDEGMGDLVPGPAIISAATTSSAEEWQVATGGSGSTAKRLRRLGAQRLTLWSTRARGAGTAPRVIKAALKAPSARSRTEPRSDAASSSADGRPPADPGQSG